LRNKDSSGNGDDKNESNQNNKKFVPREGDWKCPEATCQNINFSKRVYCNKCMKIKPGMENAQPEELKDKIGYLGGPPGLFKEGDWVCSTCKNINFCKRLKCNRC